MNAQDYSAEIGARVSTHEAFERIGHVSEWWTQNVTGRSARVGDTFTVRFGETFVDFEIAELIPDQMLVWKVTDCNLHWIWDKKEWKGTRLVWEVFPGAERTIIRLTHRGLTPGIECYDTCVRGWDFYFRESLLKLLAEGKGLPEGESTPSAARTATVAAETAA
jgi:hypothetical protein